MIQNFQSDFIEMSEMIKSSRNFAFMRFADGEIGVMKGKAVIGSDNWVSPDRVTKLGKNLLEAITRVDKNIYYGISCSCCDNDGKNYLLSLIKNSHENITFSNLFVNGNYKNFITFINQLNKPVYVIANESAGFYNFPLPILGFIPVPNDCVNYFEQKEEDIKQVLKDNLSEVKDQLFLISAGPMSEAIIDYLWTINPNNQYIDAGSSIAEFIHGQPIREFAYKQSPYYNKNCIF
jgi:hypothetical protein